MYRICAIYYYPNWLNACDHSLLSIYCRIYASCKIITFKCCYSLWNYGVSVEMKHVVIIDWRSYYWMMKLLLTDVIIDYLIILKFVRRVVVTVSWNVVDSSVYMWIITLWWCMAISTHMTTFNMYYDNRHKKYSSLWLWPRLCSPWGLILSHVLWWLCVSCCTVTVQWVGILLGMSM